ncbi:MAG: CdaR family protein, partial [Chloroflexota bacterium]|nr:CdaR family protein [Chloroflexota bacterium]
MTFLRSLRFQPDHIQMIRFVVSFLLATLLWGWVTQLQDPFKEKEYGPIPIDTTALQDTWQVVSTLPETTVTLGDASSVIDDIDESEISVRVDTDSIDGPGTYQVPLIVDSPQVNERSVEPGEVSIQVEARVTALFPLTNQNTSEGDQTRSISDVAPEVSQVTVSGPSSAVDRIESVVLPVSLGQQVDDFDGIFTPYAADGSGQPITEVDILPAEVRTQVEVQTRGKSVSVIPNTTGIPADGFSIEQRQAIPDVIVVDGPPEVLDALLFVNTEAVDVAGATESFSTRVGLADLPEGVTVIDASGGTIEVRIAITNTTQTSQSLSEVNVEQIGLSPGLSAELNPPLVSVEVNAPVEILQAMRAEDIKV